MMNVCYMFSGRDVWLDLADTLTDYGMQPALWLGDPRLDERARQRYGDCEVVDFIPASKGITSLNFAPAAPYAAYDLPPNLVEDVRFLRLKDQTIKMMDRQDDFMCFRFLEREALFYSLFNYFHAKLREKRVDMLISSEGPHAPVRFMLYGLCELLDIPRVHFTQSAVAPFMVMNTNMRGDFAPLCRPTPHHAAIYDALAAYVDSFAGEVSSLQEAGYIKKQKAVAAQSMSGVPRHKKALHALKKGDFGVFSRAISARLQKYSATAPKPKEFYTVQSLDFINEPLHLSEENQRKRKAIVSRVKALQRAYHNEACEAVTLDAPYIYFPLHYEPERTSNPDGGLYYNSYDALVALRRLVPVEIPIYVKEHSTQFIDAAHGHRGRSPYFYKAVKTMPNVRMVPIEQSSFELIEHAALTVSITGTACLEAACRGRKAVIFGHTWFSGCPNVHSYSTIESYDELLAAPTHSREDIKRHFSEFVQRYAIAGCTTPSIENYLRGKFGEALAGISDGDMIADMVAALEQGGYIRR